MRNFLLLIAVVLPQSLKQGLYRRILGWQIGSGVRIGWSFLDARQMTLGSGVQIGHFNIIRKIACLQVGDGSSIGNYNQFFGVNAPNPALPSALILGRQISFMSRHFIDVTGTVSIGDRSIIAGRDSQFWSHTLKVNGDGFLFEPLSITMGEDVYVGARVTMMGSVPDQSIIGAGSVVTKNFAPEEQRLLIAGNPAEIKKRYPREPGNAE